MTNESLPGQGTGVILSQYFQRLLGVVGIDLQLDPAHSDAVEPVGLHQVFISQPRLDAFSVQATHGDMSLWHGVIVGNSDEMQMIAPRRMNLSSI